MTWQLSDLAVTTLAASCDDTQTTISLADASAMPATGNFYVAIVDGGSQLPSEVVLVTARSGNTLTVVRGQLGKATRAHASGATAAAVFTKDMVLALPYEALGNLAVARNVGELSHSRGNSNDSAATPNQDGEYPLYGRTTDDTPLAIEVPIYPQETVTFDIEVLGTRSDAEGEFKRFVFPQVGLQLDSNGDLHIDFTSPLQPPTIGSVGDPSITAVITTPVTTSTPGAASYITVVVTGEDFKIFEWCLRIRYKSICYAAVTGESGSGSSGGNLGEPLLGIFGGLAPYPNPQYLGSFYQSGQYNSKDVWSNGTESVWWDLSTWVMSLTPGDATDALTGPNTASDPKGLYFGYAAGVATQIALVSDHIPSSVNVVDAYSNNSGGSVTPSVACDTAMAGTAGVYAQSGTYNGAPAYTNGTYWIWLQAVSGYSSFWVLSASKGVQDAPYFATNAGSSPDRPDNKFFAHTDPAAYFYITSAIESETVGFAGEEMVVVNNNLLSGVDGMFGTYRQTTDYLSQHSYTNGAWYVWSDDAGATWYISATLGDKVTGRVFSHTGSLKASEVTYFSEIGAGSHQCAKYWV